MAETTILAGEKPAIVGLGSRWFWRQSGVTPDLVVQQTTNITKNSNQKSSSNFRSIRKKPINRDARQLRMYNVSPFQTDQFLQGAK